MNSDSSNLTELDEDSVITSKGPCSVESEAWERMFESDK